MSAEAGAPGTISGKIVDPSGTPVLNATVRLLRDGVQTALFQATTLEDGQFSFTNVVPGAYQLSVGGEGFNTATVSLVLHEGETYLMPPITLTLSVQKTEVTVELSVEEIATEQMKEQEQQRVFGVIPNFYVSYVPDAAPLNTKQKFQLATKTAMDPITIGSVFLVAGIDQATNRFPGYGQGAEGYAKRLGASYANMLTGVYLSGAVFPALFRQDPRYFYKGTGSVGSRVKYALVSSVVCKGDNKKWQPCYSYVLGELSSGAISNLYYPEADRQGAALTFQNAGIGIALTAGLNILQEFVLPHLTSNIPKNKPADPQTLSSSNDSPPRF